MTKPVIVTRASKGSGITAAEMDANFNNINDAVITVTGDTGSITNSLNESFQISGGVATTSKVVNDSLIIDLDDTAVTPGSYTAADITVDAQGRITSASNGSASVTPAGSNTQLQYNNSGALGASSNLTFDGSALSAPNLVSTNSSGDEGGEIRLAKSATNTTLDTSITIDINQNRLRFFETGGTNRGVYIDLASAGASVGTNLLSGGGISDVVADTTPQLGGNLDVQANIITTSVTNGNITITPDGTGDVILSTDSVQVGESTSQARITTSGGNLRLDTNSGTNSGSIMLYSGVNGTIELEPNGTGDVWLRSDSIRVGDDNATATISTIGSGNLVLNTAGDINSGNITVTQGANANITLTPNGTGQTVIKNIEYNEYIHNLGTTGGTIAPNVTNGNVQTITLNSALTINGFTSPVAGQSLTLIINGGTAYTSITSTMKFAGGIKTLTATAGCIDILTVFYDGTTYYASLGKGFA